MSIESSVTGDFDVDYCQIGVHAKRKECFGMEKNLAIVDAEALLDPDNWQRDSDLDLYESARFPCSEAPRFSGDVSWTFVIDLDRIIFTVDWHAHFDLFNVALGLAERGKIGSTIFGWMVADVAVSTRIHHGSFYHPQCRSLSSRFLTQPSFRISPSQES